MAYSNVVVSTAFPVGWNTAYDAAGDTYAGYANGAANDVSLSNGTTLNQNWFGQLLYNENPTGNPGLALVGSGANGQTHAVGLGQFEPATAASFETDSGAPFDPTNPLQSIDAAAEYVGGLVSKFLSNGYSSDAAYAAAAKAYGDTAGPGGSSYQAKLQTALNMTPIQTLQSGISGEIDSFNTGAAFLTTNPLQGLSIIGSNTVNAVLHPSSVVANATVGATAITGAATQATTQVAAAVNPFAWVQSLFTSSFAERIVLVLLGLLLIGAAIFALSKGSGNGPSIVPVPV